MRAHTLGVASLVLMLGCGDDDPSGSPNGGAVRATEDTYSAIEDTPALFGADVGVLANDTTSGGLPLFAELVTQPANGTVSMLPNGQVSYQPNADFFGLDTFTYQASNERGRATATVTLDVSGTPDTPRAVDDEVTVVEDQSVAIDPLANDVEPDGEPLTFVLQTPPSHGALTGTGPFTYTPDPDYFGADVITYRVSDGSGASAIATIDVTITPVDDPTVVHDMHIEVVRDHRFTGELDVDNVDRDPLGFRVGTAPQHGTVTVGAASGGFIYTPAASYEGADSFTYVVSEGGVDLPPGTVSVTVLPLPAPAIGSIFPERGSTERPLQIHGAYFGASAGAVSIGGRSASVVGWTDTYVVVDVPGDYEPGDYPVVVTRAAGPASAGATYTVIPWIDGQSSEHPAAGASFTLSGDGLGSAAGTIAVGGVSALVTAWDNRQVTFTLPSGVGGLVPIEVTTAAGDGANVVRVPVGAGVWLTPRIPAIYGSTSAVWTGIEMLVVNASTIGRYDVLHDRWSETALDLSLGIGSVEAVWTGREMLVWALDGGVRYDPITDTVTPISVDGKPQRRNYFSLVWTGAEMIVWGGGLNSPGDELASGGRYDPVTDSWRPTTLVDAPAPREQHRAVWTGRHMLVWGGRHTTGAGGRYDPLTDTWLPMSEAGAPPPRPEGTATWVGEEMIVHGGDDSRGLAVSDAGRYHPILDQWTPIPGAPSASEHAAVWAGPNLLVRDTFTRVYRVPLASGAFTNVSASGNSTGRDQQLVVWTGEQMVIWSGAYDNNDGTRYDPWANTFSRMDVASHPVVLSDFAMVRAGDDVLMVGNDYELARYTPSTDTWTPVSTTGARDFNDDPLAVWTGAQLLVWGGRTVGTPDSARYDAGSDTWSSMSADGDPSGRFDARAVWTGSRMIVWGGASTGMSTGGTRYADGARYDPGSDSWSPVSTVGAPTGRSRHSAVWTGSEMVVWGGIDGSGPVATGGRYDPVQDTWRPMSTTGAPAARYNHGAVWTGSAMIVLDGSTGGGGRYDPATDTWSALPTPPGRSSTSTAPPLVAWTGSRVLITGERAHGSYDPVADAWTPLPELELAPNGTKARALWFDGEWLVFGVLHAEFTEVVRYVP